MSNDESGPSFQLPPRFYDDVQSAAKLLSTDPSLLERHLLSLHFPSMAGRNPGHDLGLVRQFVAKVASFVGEDGIIEMDAFRRLATEAKVLDAAMPPLDAVPAPAKAFWVNVLTSGYDKEARAISAILALLNEAQLGSNDQRGLSPLERRNVVRYLASRFLQQEYRDHDAMVRS
jgi:hypothetical protein